ncbi:MAG: hypothetical protein CMG50_04185 [Candidatus Marinimicrobia bacterium]|nr:hypothetical protein [Candidatus Neomarinimicrobiota bacterium]|tara:strand:- start:6393 stop:7232 length:840 start_codon:yes stop_codon:yes gene_type:complete
MNLARPIIITGMHRSGTTLIVKLLENNGVYFGSYQDSNKESIFFQRLNRWLVSFNNSYWDNPKAFNLLIENDTDLLVSKLKKTINNKFLYLFYFGIINTFKNNNFENFSKPWGFKDPLNTFTLDLWKKIFPDLCVVNIVRNPLDVSCSLINRQNKLKKKDIANINSFFDSFIQFLSIYRGGIYRSLKINTINDSLELYKKYYDQTKINNSKGIKQLNMKFEDLINNTDDEILKLYNFCGVRNFDLNNDCKMVDKNIINKYKDSDIEYNKKLLESISYDD